MTGPVDAPVLERHRRSVAEAYWAYTGKPLTARYEYPRTGNGGGHQLPPLAQAFANLERDARRDAVAEERAAVVRLARQKAALFDLSTDLHDVLEDFAARIERGDHHAK